MLASHYNLASYNRILDSAGLEVGQASSLSFFRTLARLHPSPQACHEKILTDIYRNLPQLTAISLDIP
jgi:hypothetical protein